MEKKYINQKLKMLVAILVTILSIQGVNATDIVGYSLLTGTAGAATSGVAINYPGLGRVLSTVGVTNKSYSNSGNTCSNWSSAAINENTPYGWVTNAFSTAGYIQTAVAGQINASTLGPKDLKAQYSLNGSVWIDVPNDPSYSDDNPLITTTGSPAPFKFRLPTACDNKSTVYFRLIQNSLVSQNGQTVVTGTNNTATLKSVVVQSELFGPPTSQASGISLISITPTTITVGCTRGGGNRRILKMNTTNNFTDPYDDYNPSANLNYSGGEQVVYNGSESTVTVIVPSSLNQYWFRYYDYNAMDALTRYCTLGPYDTNPKLCALPNIHTPTYDFGLIRATLGATVASNGNTDLIDMGVYWSTSPNVDASKIGVQHLTPGFGTFTVDTEVDRGSTIYFKGYAENESGVILSAESSFSNKPVFTGTGDWEMPGLWNTNEVPGELGDPTYGSIDDSPTINGNCTLTSSNNCTNLTINSGKVLSINTATTLNVVGTLTNNAGSSGLVVKSAENEPNATLVWSTGNPAGTVQMFSKAYYDTKYHWQYFGTPVTNASVGSVFSGNSFVRKYDETNHDPLGTNVGLWDLQSSGTTMLPVDGYEVGQTSATTYNFRGTLYHGNISKAIAYTPTADWAGNHILANPYTAAINIAQINFGLAEAAAYLYNTGSLAEWTANSGSSTPGINPGTYIAVPSVLAGTYGIPSQIPSMQGFLVKTSSATTISIPYASTVGNTVAQRAPSAKSNDKVATIIDVIGDQSSDRMWIFTEPNCTRTFNNGFDGRKMFASGSNTQIFAQETDGEYQINAIDDINNSSLGFQAGNSTSFKMQFTHQNTNSHYPSIYLVDLVANKTIDVSTSGSEYTFTADVSTVPVNRFKIVTSPTKVNNAAINSQLKVISTKEVISVQNQTQKVGNIKLYKLDGTLVLNAKFEANGITTLPVNLGTGVYVAKATIDLEELTQRIIIR